MLLPGPVLGSIMLFHRVLALLDFVSSGALRSTPCHSFLRVLYPKSAPKVVLSL